MRTMYLDVHIPRILLTRLLGRFWPAAYFAPTAPLHLDLLPEPPLPADNWIRVRNRLCGICGSDLHQMFLDTSLKVAPLALPAHQRIYLGHEMVGVVEEVGPSVTEFKLGDRVVRWGRAVDCLARGRTTLCPPCQQGHRVLCQHASEPLSFHPIGGGFGDTFITPASTLLPVPEALTDEQAIFAEPAAVAIHAAFRKQIDPGDQVLVLGCGTIGFLLIQAILARQPDCEITALAEFPWQAELASQYGAAHTFLVQEDGYAESARLTGAQLYQGRGGNRMLMGGYDLVFDVVGIAATLGNALRWTRAGGAVVLVGVNLHPMALDLTPVWYQEVDLLGAVGHDIVSWQGQPISTFALAMLWMQQRIIRPERLLTHRFPLERYRQAFLTAADKHQYQSIKVAFDQFS